MLYLELSHFARVAKSESSGAVGELKFCWDSIQNLMGEEATMPYYKGVLDGLIAAGDSEGAGYVADRLLRLKTRLRKELPERNVTRNILLATWNLREFGRNQKCGVRLEESLL